MSVSEAAARALDARLLGEVLIPTDARYDHDRAIFNARIDKHPALIAYCCGVADVIASVQFAREHGLPVVVRAGGHSPAGYCVPDGGILLDVSDMDGIWLDPERRAITVQAGATWRDVNHETAPFGLAVPGGECPTVGVAGFTLGGGWGYLARSFGLAADTLIAVTLVTADGRLITASDDAHPDLFWALRGGGAGSFGVATSFTFRLHPVPRQMLAGEIGWPIAQAREVIRVFRDYFTTTAPDALSFDLNLCSAPDGSRVVSIMGLFNGSVAAGTAAIAPFLACGRPHYVDLEPRSYEALVNLYGDAILDGAKTLWKSGFIEADFSDAAVDAMVEAFAAAPPGASSCILEVLGGAIGRVGPHETAFLHRQSLLSLTAIGSWNDDAQAGPAAAWARAFKRAMAPHLSGYQYANYPDGDLAEWPRAYYGENYARLAAVKRTYDPDNLFRFEQSVRSTESSTGR